MNNIINKIKDMGYKFENDQNGINIYKVNNQGYVTDDIYFTINGQNELYKTERNASTMIGKYDSIEYCLLIMYFKLTNSYIGMVDKEKIKEYFKDAKDLNDIEMLLRKMYGDEFVSNNIFF